MSWTARNSRNRRHRSTAAGRAREAAATRRLERARQLALAHVPQIPDELHTVLAAGGHPTAEQAWAGELAIRAACAALRPFQFEGQPEEDDLS